MIYIPLKYLKPNMILARSVPSSYNSLPLITAGQKVTVSVVDKLTECGIQGVYIESEFSDDISPGDLIEPEFKQEMLTNVKKVCKDFVQRSALSETMFCDLSNMATSLVEQILSRDQVLLNIIDIKDYDSYTYLHSISVGILSVLIGIQLGKSQRELNELAICGLLHDIGKLEIPPAIVNKPKRLTDEEFRTMQRHPVIAVQRLNPNRLFPRTVLDGILTHHERFDGSGYTRGLKGGKIPLYGRILALADVYDALTSTRPYRKAWYPDKTINFMISQSGSHFDPDLLNQFLRTVSAYPVGTIVRLSNGYVGLVIHNTPGQCLRPQIRIMEPVKMKKQVIDLAQDTAYLNVTVENTNDDDVAHFYSQFT